jgi:SAM-dependent methyltransferase
MPPRLERAPAAAAARAPPRAAPPPPPAGRRAALAAAAAALLLPPRRCARAAEDAAISTLPAAPYDAYAATYDDLDGGPLARALGFDGLRAALLARAAGDVLELGVGTGLNLARYPRGAALASYTGVDLSAGMLARARAAAAAAPNLPPGAALRFVRADVVALPFPDSSFDTVVDTFSLCVFPDPAAALREAARVARPGGRVLLLEHARAPNALAGAYQDLTAGVVAATAKGCRWNDDVLALVRGAGLEPVAVRAALGGLVLSVEAVKPGG